MSTHSQQNEQSDTDLWNQYGISWKSFLMQEHYRLQQQFIKLAQQEAFLNKKENRLKKWESSLQRRQREFNYRVSCNNSEASSE